MQLGKVVGTVVSTRKDEKLVGLSLQIVRLIDENCQPLEGFLVAVDTLGAGVGEVVLVVTGSSARQTKTTDGKPVDGTIMAIVDVMEIGGKIRYTK